MKIIVGISGATGAIFGIRILQLLSYIGSSSILKRKRQKDGLEYILLDEKN